MWSGEPPSVFARADRDGHACLKCPVLKPCRKGAHRPNVVRGHRSQDTPVLLPPYHHIGTAPAAGTASSRQALPQHPELAKEFAQSQVLRCARITSYSIGVEGGGLAPCVR